MLRQMFVLFVKVDGLMLLVFHENRVNKREYV
jgi:hypothetical protein